MRCLLCGARASRAVGACYSCLVKRPQEALGLSQERSKWRLRLGLPERPPRGGKKCYVCVNECEIPDGGVGYCGVWVNRGSLEPKAGRERLIYTSYLDPLPTNCVATPVCPAAGRGYPEFSAGEEERSYYNLAVFLAGCQLHCLFCQNWEHKPFAAKEELWGANSHELEELVEEALNPRVACVCYFGGDPTPQAPLLLRASREILRRSRERGQRYKRICWETSGLMNPSLMREAARLSLESGGIVKIDWKAWTPSVYEALTGADGERAQRRLRENAKAVAEMGKGREPPLLVISVLLVPGYVTAEEVGKIAEFAASLDANVPLVLLAFHPDHLMTDVGYTSYSHAMEAVKEAKRAGVKEVYLGNEWLLRL
ncbi:MAG: radical SAM protein [Acidilobaceae archaeon]|nr:radical SAM protein [Acidilobaceae archaeon]